jgi:spore coat protein U-like protein
VLRILIAAILLLLSVSAANAALCTVNIGTLDFGSIDTLGGSPSTSSTDVSIDCDGITPGTPTMALCANIGAGGGGESGGLRRMTGGALGFGLYASSGTSAPWGSTSSDLGNPNRIELTVNGESNSASGTVQLYGLIPTGQGAVPAGSYSAAFSSADVDFKYSEGALDCSAPTGADDAHADFSVTAMIPANCLLVTHDLDFGTTGLIGNRIDAETNLDITCTPDTAYTISIDGGGSHDPENRVMHSGSDTVRYGLYSDSQRSAVWGTDAGSTVSGEGTGSEDQQPVYGSIPPQSAAPGRYTDTVVVTISY